MSVCVCACVPERTSGDFSTDSRAPLVPLSPDYSLKIKDSRTRKTLGKVKVDFRKYCKLESQFNRSFVELSATAKVKVFLVVSSELVDEEQEDATTSPSPTSASDTRRTMSATFASPKTSLQDVGGDKANASGQTFSASMHEMASPSLASPDLIQQSIDILHSSSEEEEEEERGWQSKLQAIARRLTPKATPSGPPRRHTAPVGQAVTPPPVTTPQVSKALFAEREASRPVPVEAQAPLNPFGAPAMTSSSSEEGESLVDSDSTCRTPDSSKVVKEMELLRTQCDHLQSENALLKDRLVTQEKESAALRERLRQVQARAKEKVEEEGVGEGQGEGASNPFAGVAKMVSPRKNDMIEELITVKMKLAQAQSSLDELKRQQSQ